MRIRSLRLVASAFSPLIVQVILACLNQQNRQVVIKIREAARRDTSRAAATADDDINFVWDSHNSEYVDNIAIENDYEESARGNK